MNVRKAATAVCLATLMTATSFSSVTPFPQTTITAEAASSTISIKQAGKKIAKATKKAYENKETVSVTVRLKGKKNYNSTMDLCTNLRGAAMDAELGMKAYHGIYQTQSSMPALGGLTSGQKRTPQGWTIMTKFSGGVWTLDCKINGKNKEFRENYEEILYEKKLIKEAQELTEGMNQYDKAWETAIWLGGRMTYYGIRSEVKVSTKDLWEHHARGLCEELADMYCKYAWYAGVKNVAKVGSEEENHAWNAVKIDGKVWYLDMQAGWRSSYDWLVENKDYLLEHRDQLGQPTDPEEDIKLATFYSRLSSYENGSNNKKLLEDFMETGEITMSKGECELRTEDEVIENSADDAMVTVKEYKNTIRKNWEFSWNKSSPY